jgi:hypothetical protein
MGKARGGSAVVTESIAPKVLVVSALGNACVVNAFVIASTWKQFVPIVIAMDLEIETAQLHRNVIRACALSVPPTAGWECSFRNDFIDESSNGTAKNV